MEHLQDNVIEKEIANNILGGGNNHGNAEGTPPGNF